MTKNQTKTTREEEKGRRKERLHEESKLG
uniref:Uncharacterized protein n=1 Tax=Anguilla anguilla TaxID=7936 RepID=A0A0E9UTN8_ANGAN